MGISDGSRLVDDTGREFEVHQRRPAAAYDDGFTLLFDRGCACLAQAGISGTAYRTLFILLSPGPLRLQFESWRSVPGAELATALDANATTATRALALLVALGLIERRGRGGGRERAAAQYRLTTSLGWRGRATQYWALKKEKPERRGGRHSRAS